MAGRLQRDMTLEEFDAWAAAQRNVSDTKDAGAEEGGPRVSLVPLPSSVPVDFLPDEVSIAGPTPTGLHAVPFSPEPSRKAGGWSAERQKHFIESLAETGSVHLSAKSAGLSARSAYGLRVRSAPFAAAWDAAQQLAVGRLSALAFDRAIHGGIQQTYRDGELIGEKQVPSERLSMWLLARLDPKRFAAPWERRKDDNSDPQAEAQQAFPTMLEVLEDVAAD
ncbi:hypothetical protein [Sphingomonas sp.]|uniref:hypothetical protein n=1 Tax=Sphingomonas sp. TaxID=28214 RepID=UPI0025FF6D65|nr:hypothetical protein [Sphingomonas sp.]